MNNLILVNNKTMLKSGISDIISMFITAQDIKQTSKETYERCLRQFMTYLQAQVGIRPDRQTILDYKNSLLNRGISPMTIGTYLTTIRVFFKWASSNGYYPNIAQDIKGIKKPKGHRKDCLTVSQIKDLLNSIDTSTLQGKRDFALLNLMLRAGLRTIEVIRADIQDIRQDSGEALLYIQGKGRDTKDEFVLLTPDTLRPITDYLQARGKVKDTDPLFVSLSDRNKNQRLTTRTIRGLVKTYLKGIGLISGRLTSHSLRHTAITLSLMAGATLQETQAMARHNSINTTMIYAHNINRLSNAPERRIDQFLKTA